MLFTRPQPFAVALAQLRQRTLLPTSGATAELQRLQAPVRERAFFSAKVRLAEHLDVLRSGADALVAGEIDPATARLQVTQFLRALGYEPEPGTAGTLQDLGSRERIDLQLRTNAQQAQGFGWWKQGQDEMLLDAFPAQEFIRVESREVPRQDWPQRWNEARAATTGDGATDSASGRMVALKNHPIWAALSRFGTPYEPFDFNSGMGVEDVDRREAMALGLITRDTRIPPDDRPFNDTLQASPSVRSQALRTLLEESGAGSFDAAGVFHFAGGGT